MIDQGLITAVLDIITLGMLTYLVRRVANGGDVLAKNKNQPARTPETPPDWRDVLEEALARQEEKFRKRVERMQKRGPVMADNGPEDSEAIAQHQPNELDAALKLWDNLHKK